MLEGLFSIFPFGRLGVIFFFEQEVISSSAYCGMWCDEVHHPLFSKGSLLIKDVRSLDSLSYSNFSSALLVLWKSA